MLIQLKQNEIEAALRMFISSQGINLTGRKVDIFFTAGRGNNGLTADLDIQEVANVVDMGCSPVHPVKEEEVVAYAAPAQEDPVVQAEEEEVILEEEKPKPSLFG